MTLPASATMLAFPGRLTTLSRMIAASCLVWIGISTLPAADLDARQTAEGIGSCLARGCGPSWRSLLPTRGKVDVSLSGLGGPRGSFAPEQARAVLDELAGRGGVAGFDVVSVESGATAFALARLRSKPKPGQTSAPIAVHIVLQREDDRWALREIRDDAP